MTERHLETLIEDTNSALTVLASLSESFRSVEDQTTSFQSQCDDLLSEQKRLQALADEVGTDLHYYTYLDNVSRRLNAPGASRLVDGDPFGEILDDLDSCIVFMMKNVRPSGFQTMDMAITLLYLVPGFLSHPVRLTHCSPRIEMPSRTWRAISP